MENASKALIIAGAILLSILIIGLGMFIYQQASGAISGANLDPEKIQAYNSPFEQYANTQSGTKVKALLNKVRSHNNASLDDASSQIDIVEGDASGVTTAPESAIDVKKVNDALAKIKTGKMYTVTFGYDKNTGYIVAAGFEEKK